MLRYLEMMIIAGRGIDGSDFSEDEVYILLGYRRMSKTYQKLAFAMVDQIWK